MKTQVTGGVSRKVSLAIGIITLAVLGIAAVYLFTGNTKQRPVNAARIFAAAKAYTQYLKQTHAAPQATVPLKTLLDQKMLAPEDLGSLEGVDATVFLVAPGGLSPLMDVKMNDGSEFVVLNDGSVREVRH